MSAYDLPIDLVYLYVNSSDEAWIAKRIQYAMDQSNSTCRFRDNEELIYSLRSVEKYAPWIRNIYIVSNSCMPAWLNTDHPKLRIINQESIMPSNTQPCFNSSVIEAYLYKIPGLSEIFLYACDDMFFGNHVQPDFFVENGKPIVRMQKSKIVPTDYYSKTILNSINVIFDHYGEKYKLTPWHNIDVYSKTGMEMCAKEFRNEFAACSHNHIRKDNDLQRVIFHYYLIVNNSCILKTYDRSSLIMRGMDYIKRHFFPFIQTDYLICTIHYLSNNPYIIRNITQKPVCVCLNDSEDTTDSDVKYYQFFMNKLFLERSSFEK